MSIIDLTDQNLYTCNEFIIPDVYSLDAFLTSPESDNVIFEVLGMSKELEKISIEEILSQCSTTNKCEEEVAPEIKSPLPKSRSGKRKKGNPSTPKTKINKPRITEKTMKNEQNIKARERYWKKKALNMLKLEGFTPYPHRIEQLIDVFRQKYYRKNFN